MAVGRTRDIGRIGMQINIAGDGHSGARPQEAVVTVNQFRRQQIVAQQPSWSVKIGQDVIEQRRPLAQRGLDPVPFARVDNQRDRVQRPRPIGRRRVAIDVVSDAVIVQQPASFLPAAQQAAVADRGERIDQRTPMRAHRTVGRNEFIVKSGIGLVCQARPFCSDRSPGPRFIPTPH